MNNFLRCAVTGVAAILLAACAPLSSRAPAASPSGATAEILWLGQSAFRIRTPNGKVIVTDPWLKANPATPAEYKNLERLGHVDLVLVTHGHFDHIADAPGIRITEVHAEHSSVYVWKNPASGEDEAHYGGEPVGFIIELENGFRIWHMGDTGLFSDMKFIAEHYRPDVVLLPIGGNFTMDPKDAAFATREWIKPKYAIAMHYGTNPLARGTLPQYLEALGSTATRVIQLKPGEKVDL
jgi:L-ascorbate metabolism protein UlaG (beta-lactamase superfamily)